MTFSSGAPLKVSTRRALQRFRACRFDANRKRDMKKTVYLTLCIAGTILPYSFLIPFLNEHGLSEFFKQLFANRVSGFFAVDVIVSSFTLWFFVYWEGKRRGMKYLWICVVCNLLVGVSLGLPLFLLMRERTMQ